MVKNKKAAMEMTMGTVVTIVLLIAVLIMVLYFIGKIRDVGEEAIDGINQNVISEINKLFSEDNTRKIVIYPSSRFIKLEKSDRKGFGFSIRNTEETPGVFSYEIKAQSTSCGDNLRLPAADALLAFGTQKSGINILAGSKMDYPEEIMFDIPADSPPCLIDYGIDVKKDGAQYTPSTVAVKVEILSA